MTDETRVEERESREPSRSCAPNSGCGALMKDLSIPIAIVIAGLAVAAGLYFGGSPVTKTSQDSVENQPAAVVDNTGKVTPVSEGEHIRGNFNAPIKIVEYSDFDCPFCSRFHETMKVIAEKYSGENVAWVLRQFPLEQLHPQAPAVALASECVAEIGGNEAFWKFTDAYYSARGSGDSTAHGELIPKLVIEARVNEQVFTECFESGRHEADVEADESNGVETGGRGTPWSILIGPSGKTYPINGAVPQQAIEQLIELAKQEA